MRKERLLIAGALGLIGSLLAIFGIFLPWRVSWRFGYEILGWDMITTTIIGNLNIFLVFIGGIVAFFGWLALALAFIGNRSLAIKLGIISFLLLWLVIALAGWIWTFLKYGDMPQGLFVSGFGVGLAMAGSGYIGLTLEWIREKEKMRKVKPSV
jgi:hypothetical protein